MKIIFFMAVQIVFMGMRLVRKANALVGSGSTAVFADAVQDGTGIIDREAVVGENMCFEAVEIRAGDMEELAAGGAFQMKMCGAGGGRIVDELKAGRLLGRRNVFTYKAGRDELIELAIDGSDRDGDMFVFEKIGDVLGGHMVLLILF